MILGVETYCRAEGATVGFSFTDVKRGNGGPGRKRASWARAFRFLNRSLENGVPPQTDALSSTNNTKIAFRIDMPNYNHMTVTMRELRAVEVCKCSKQFSSNTHDAI